MEAAGTAANLIFGLVFAGWLVLFPPASPAWRYFLWLSSAVNLLQAGGYLLIAPLAGFGDWRAFVEGLPGRLAWKIALTVLGVFISMAALRFCRREIAPFCAAANPWVLVAIPYLVGGVASCAIALLNAVDRTLVIRSAAAATFGGTCWLLWIGYLVTVEPPLRASIKPLVLEASPTMIVLALVGLALWAAVLGPGRRVQAPWSNMSSR